jgi:hypothetical protein
MGLLRTGLTRVADPIVKFGVENGWLTPAAALNCRHRVRSQAMPHTITAGKRFPMPCPSWQQLAGVPFIAGTTLQNRSFRAVRCRQLWAGMELGPSLCVAVSVVVAPAQPRLLRIVLTGASPRRPVESGPLRAYTRLDFPSGTPPYLESLFLTLAAPPSRGRRRGLGHQPIIATPLTVVGNEATTPHRGVGL